jgi:hypothetical protein
MITIAVKNLRSRGHETIRVVERTPTARAGYTIVNYKGCQYRIQWPNGKPFIDLNEPMRCRGEKWPKPTGKERRDLCAAYKRKFKLTRRTRRRDAAWWLSRARWLRCDWRKEAIRK